MKNKLIEMLLEREAVKDANAYDRAETLADFLIEKGVIVPPCKVGDDIYWVDTETNEIILEKAAIKAVCYYGGGKFKVVCGNEKEPEEIGTQWCNLTREEAKTVFLEVKK